MLFLFVKEEKEKKPSHLTIVSKSVGHKQWCLFLGNALGVAWRGSE